MLVYFEYVCITATTSLTQCQPKVEKGIDMVWFDRFKTSKGKEHQSSSDVKKKDHLKDNFSTTDHQADFRLSRKIC